MPNDHDNTKEVEMMEERLAISVPEAAKMLGLGRTSTWTLVRQGKLRCVRVNKRVLIPRSAVLALLEPVKK